MTYVVQHAVIGFPSIYGAPVQFEQGSQFTLSELLARTGDTLLVRNTLSQHRQHGRVSVDYGE